MLSLITTFLLALFAVSSFASPWTLRARNDSSPLRARKEEYQLPARRGLSVPNFSLPFHPRSESTVLRTRSDSSREFLEFRNETTPARPRDAFAFRPSIRPRKIADVLAARDGSSLLHLKRNALPLVLVGRQEDNSSDPNYPSATNSSAPPALPIPTPPIPGINATILSANGTDITPTFRIMLYRSPDIVALTSMNGRNKKHRRQVNLARPVAHCQSPTAVFSYSHCTKHEGVSDSMRTYIVFCRERNQNVRDPGKYSPKGRLDGYQRPRAEIGTCHPDEICFDGKQELAPFAQMARCVPRREFQPIIDLPSTNDLQALARQESGDMAGASMDNLVGMTGGSGGSGGGGASSSSQNLAGFRASAVLTGVDEETPLKADELEVDAGLAASMKPDGTVNPDGTARRESSCDRCLQVQTPELPEETNWMRVRAGLTIAGVVGGILWIALLN